MVTPARSTCLGTACRAIPGSRRISKISGGLQIHRHLSLSGRRRSRPIGYIYGCASAEQINLFCSRLLRNLADAIYTAAPRQLQTSLHCSRLLCIFAAGIEVWCNGSTTDFGSVCPGSNPGTSTEKVRPFDRTFLIHSSFLNVYVSRGLQIPCNV